MNDDTPPIDPVAAYDARRCYVCECRHAPFGFGRPLTRGAVLWACGADRAALDALIQRDHL